MQAQAKDVFDAYVAKNFGDDVSLEDFTYLGDYLLTSKNYSGWDGYNYLFLVYKVGIWNTISNEKGSYDEKPMTIDTSDSTISWLIRMEKLVLMSLSILLLTIVLQLISALKMVGLIKHGVTMVIKV